MRRECVDSVAANGSGVSTNGAGILKTGSGVSKTGSGVSKTGSGVSKTGSGVSKTGSGVSKTGFGRLEDWLGRLEDRLGRLEDWLGRLEDWLGRLEDWLGRLEDRFGRFEDRRGRLENRLGCLEDRRRCFEDWFLQYRDKLSGRPGVRSLADGFDRFVDRWSVVGELRRFECGDRRGELRGRSDLAVGDRFVAIETAGFERGVRLRGLGNRCRDLNGRLGELGRRAFFGRGLQIRRKSAARTPRGRSRRLRLWPASTV